MEGDEEVGEEVDVEVGEEVDDEVDKGKHCSALVDTADEWITMDGDGGRDNERQQRALRNN